MRAGPPMTVTAARLLVTGIATAIVVALLVTDPSFAAPSTAARAAASSVPSRPIAVISRQTHLVENAQLHLASEGESTLNERGKAAGTFNAPVSAHLDLSVGHVTAVFTLYPKGGSLTGKAQARFAVKGSIAYYGGTLTITHGTGVYRHASGSNIAISGTINHLNFNLTVKANGWITL